ncbi:MAG: putative 2OG-Fe(II) oxygenase [Candidatus Xenobia bacterium]
METLSLYPTPVTVFHLADMDATNREVADLLLAEQASSPGVQVSNVGGWHSRPDLTTRTEPGLSQLLAAIVDRVGQHVVKVADGTVPPIGFAVSAWAMIMRDGDYTVVHDHCEAHWSTVYYVDAGDSDHPKSGLLAFLDPRRPGRPIPYYECGTQVTIRPRTGALVVFPSWLQHHVHPYRGRGPRISISCNLVIHPGSSG